MSQFVDLFDLVHKAYSEGIYVDNPKNRKLGRVGMSYKEWTNKLANNSNKEESNNKGSLKDAPYLSSLLAPKVNKIIAYTNSDEFKEANIEGIKATGNLQKDKQAIFNYYVKQGNKPSEVDGIVEDILEGAG